MSIIQQQKERIVQLTAEKKQTEEDMAFVAKTFKEAWDGLGIDFSKMDSKSGRKPNMFEMTKLAMGIANKMITGSIKIDDLIKKWDSVTPVLAKYEHVLEPKKLEENV